MIVKILVENQTLKTIEKPSLWSESKDFIKFNFEFTDDWDDLLVFAQFKQEQETYNVYLDENKTIYLPSEIASGAFKLTLCGTKGTVKATTSSLVFILNPVQLTEDGKSTLITQTLYEQLVNRIEWGNALGIDHIETKTSLEDEGVNIVTFVFTDDTEKTFTVRNGSRGARGEQGEQGLKGDKGDTGARGEQGEQGVKGDKGDTGAQGIQGDKGETGERGSDGADGQDGYSPTVAVSKTDGVTTVTITDKDGTKTAEIKDGEKGDKGDKGDTGAQGVKGDKGDKGDAAEVTVDTALDATSTHPVTNSAIAAAINAKADSKNAVFTESISLGRNGVYKTGNSSIAVGYDNIASGDYSSSVGYQCASSGLRSHAEGSSTTASGNSSHSEGYEAQATGNYGSHAEGYKTKATGSYGSHAEGSNTAASGNYSHAEGGVTQATGIGSHAEGFYTIAASVYQHAQGKYNVADTANKYAHIVGGGTSESARKNIHTIDWNGNTYYSGDGTFTIDGTEYTISAIINAIKALGGTL